jgi:hypothetical protein
VGTAGAQRRDTFRQAWLLLDGILPPQQREPEPSGTRGDVHDCHSVSAPRCEFRRTYCLHVQVGRKSVGHTGGLQGGRSTAAHGASNSKVRRTKNNVATRCCATSARTCCQWRPSLAALSIRLFKNITFKMQTVLPLTLPDKQSNDKPRGRSAHFTTPYHGCWYPAG